MVRFSSILSLAVAAHGIQISPIVREGDLELHTRDINQKVGDVVAGFAGVREKRAAGAKPATRGGPAPPPAGAQSVAGGVGGAVRNGFGEQKSKQPAKVNSALKSGGGADRGTGASAAATGLKENTISNGRESSLQRGGSKLTATGKTKQVTPSSPKQDANRNLAGIQQNPNGAGINNFPVQNTVSNKFNPPLPTQDAKQNPNGAGINNFPVQNGFSNQFNNPFPNQDASFNRIKQNPNGAGSNINFPVQNGFSNQFNNPFPSQDASFNRIKNNLAGNQQSSNRINPNQIADLEDAC